jgi:hypothetical protein
VQEPVVDFAVLEFGTALQKLPDNRQLLRILGTDRQGVVQYVVFVFHLLSKR